MAQFEFNQNNFPSLTLLEPTQKWTDLGIEDLAPQEAEPLLEFLELCKVSADFDYGRIILCKAQGGVVQGIYDPAIFKDGNRIVIKIGTNVLEVQQTKDSFSIGSLRGRISITEEKNQANEPYPKAKLVLISPNRDIFKIGVRLASLQQGFTVAEIEAAMLQEEPLIPFLIDLPGSSSNSSNNTIKMQDLGLGEFGVQSISETESTEHGTNYKLLLVDGRTVWSRGNVTTLLRSGWKTQQGRPLTLAVTRIEKIGESDKYGVDCALRERSPKLTDGNGNGRHLRIVEANLPSIVEGKAIEVKATRIVSSQQVSDLDDIPF